MYHNVISEKICNGGIFYVSLTKKNPTETAKSSIVTTCQKSKLYYIFLTSRAVYQTKLNLTTSRRQSQVKSKDTKLGSSAAVLRSVAKMTIIDLDLRLPKDNLR